MSSRPKRSLSQNFLIDPNLRRKLVNTLDPDPEQAVLEVGAGHGELTELLVDRVACLVAVEKDDALAEELARRWTDRPHVRIVHGDALELDLGAMLPADRSRAVVSNIPYAITSPLIFSFLAMRPAPRRIVVTVQKEVAVRLVAPAGSRAYGALSVGVQVHADARIAFPIGRRAFRPVPAVDSAAVVLDTRRPGLSAARFGALRRLTRAAFGMRRKQLQKILRTAPDLGLSEARAAGVLRELGIDSRTRPEELSPAQFVALADALLGPAGELP